MHVVLAVLAILIGIILVLTVRVLIYHPTWKQTEERLPETPAEKPMDESAYWKTRADYFITSAPLNRFYYEIHPLAHGMFIRYKGTSEQKGMILFCIYDQKQLDSLALALERIMRHNEAPASGFCVLFAHRPSRAASEEALAYMKENYIHADLTLTISGAKAMKGGQYTYLFLGTDRKKTMVLEARPALKQKVSLVYETPLTLPALKQMRSGMDSRLLHQFELNRKKGLSSLQNNPALCAALCSTGSVQNGEIRLEGADDEAVEKMLDECRYAAADEGASLYVKEEGESGRSSRERSWMKKITAAYAHCDLTEVIPCFYTNDEEACLERVSSEHMSFLPGDLRQCSIIDFYVSLLLS